MQFCDSLIFNIAQECASRKPRNPNIAKEMCRTQYAPLRIELAGPGASQYP